MCFSEFIGYSCGHQSPEVLRACPLTTQISSNPACGTYGRRPILAPCMCPGCQRILHGRCVLTLEWEHHWMHERGVCGCPVIFPDLIQPRIIVPFSPNKQPTQPFHRSPPAFGTSNGGEVPQTFNNNGKTMVVLPKKPAVTSTSGSKKRRRKSPGKQGYFQPNKQNKGGDVPRQAAEGLPGGTKPAASEHNGTTGGSDDKSKEVQARIHSLYGAEWIEEHRQLHNTGSCKCASDFMHYKTPSKYGFTEASFLALYDQEQAMRTQLGNQYQALKPVYPSWQPGLENIQEDTDAQAVAMQVGAWSSSQELVVRANLDQPVRSAGSIWQMDRTKSTNPLWNYACTEGGRMDGRGGTALDLQGIDYIKAKDAAPPIVGLPIGAGPEAPEYFQHMGSFEDCALNPHNKGKEAEDAIDTSQSEEEIDTQDVASIVVALLAEAKDLPETKLFRLHHQKSASC